MTSQDMSIGADPRIIMDEETGLIVVRTDDDRVATFRDGRWEPGHTVPLRVSMVGFREVRDEEKRAQFLDAASAALAQYAETHPQRHKIAALSTIVKDKDSDITIVVNRDGLAAHFMNGVWQPGLPRWFTFDVKTLSDRDLDDVWDDGERARILAAASEALQEDARMHGEEGP